MAADDALIQICASAALRDGGRGVRFEVDVPQRAGAGVCRAPPAESWSPT